MDRPAGRWPDCYEVKKAVGVAQQGVGRGGREANVSSLVECHSRPRSTQALGDLPAIADEPSTACQGFGRIRTQLIRQLHATCSYRQAQPQAPRRWPTANHQSKTPYRLAAGRRP